MIIFEGEELILHHNKGKTNYIIISFMGTGHKEEANTQYFLKSIVEKKNISCLGMTTKVYQYYIHPEIEVILSLCNEITKDYQKVIVIGLSMGGYAALKYSKRLKADVVFAMAPRCTLDQEVCPLATFPKSVAMTMSPDQVKQSTIRQDDLGGKIYLVYDPLGLPFVYDKENAGFIYNLIPGIIKIPTFFSGHIVITHLQGTNVFLSIIECLAYKTDQDVIKTVTYIRRHHINNILRKFTLINKYPLLTYKILASKTLTKIRNNNIIYEDYTLRLKLCYLLNTKGYQQESSECLKASFLYNLQNIRYDPNQPIIGLTPYPFLINYHGCYIGYDLINKTLEAITNILQKPFCLPLQIYKQNGKFKVICIHNGVIFELKYTNSSHFNLTLLSNSYTSDHVKLSFHGNYIFIHPIIRKYYITVTAENSIAYDRIAPAEWETFTAVSMVSPSEITTQDYHSPQLDNDNFTISKY